MTGMGSPVDIWVVWAVIFVSGFVLINRHYNKKEDEFKREHPDEDYY